MDPYLQARWSDVHAKLIAFIGEALQPALPAGLRARSEERVLLETIDGDPVRRYRGDVAIVETRPGEPKRFAPDRVTTVEPVVIEFSDEPYVDRFVQIIDVTNGNRVITVIEVLSPWNKSPGRLNDDYRRKLKDFARGSVSVVEIDLVRASRSRLMVTESDLPLDRRSPYLACVRRGWLGERWEAYPLPLREQIPAVPIPLRETDNDVPLELQPLIERVYVSGGHDDIDYRQPCLPPLEAEEEAWADQLLKTSGKR